MPKRPDIRLRRIYDVGDGRVDGHRILVDRLWPRGVSKSDAALDEWLKDIAPSTELRRWYGHEVPRFEEFARRYCNELRRAPASTAIEHVIELAGTDTVTLVTATRDVEHSGARVLHDRLMRRRPRSPRARTTPRRSAGGPVDVSTAAPSSGAEASTTKRSDVATGAVPG